MEDTMRIAYASDFSPASRAAFSMALRLTRATGGELTILARAALAGLDVRHR